MHYIPTFEECCEICENNTAFIHKIEDVQSFKAHIFNYHLASYGDFNLPVSEKPHIKAHELRGLTFIECNGSYNRFLMLHKFFVLNQTENYLYDDVKNKKIVRIQEKLDGSMIRFVKLQDGLIVAKTKMGFTNDQALIANEIFSKNPSVSALVEDCLDDKIAAIFELVSPYNQIVVNYKNTELRLLQLRNEDSGEYIHEVNKYCLYYNIKGSHEFDYDLKNDESFCLDHYIQEADTKKDFEGWVFTFEDGQMMKLKTKWYLELHHLLTESINRENSILIAIINENIDDAISQIPQNNEMRNKVIEITEKMNSFCSSTIRELIHILQEHNLVPEYRKDFAIQYHKYPYFGVLMKNFKLNWNEIEIEKCFKEFMLKKIDKLSDAQHFVKDVLKIKFKSKEFEIDS